VWLVIYSSLVSMNEHPGRVRDASRLSPADLRSLADAYFAEVPLWVRRLPV
jgi:hypothetical protein